MKKRRMPLSKIYLIVTLVIVVAVSIFALTYSAGGVNMLQDQTSLPTNR